MAARRAQVAGRCRARARHDGAARRRLQPLRAGRKLSRPLCAGFFHPERHTPWGAAIAYEKAPVRRFFIENALYWLAGVSLRRPAARCHRPDRRSVRDADPRGAGRRGAPHDHRPARSPDDRGRPQHRASASSATRTGAHASTTANGTTTSTMPRTSWRPARATATTPTTRDAADLARSLAEGYVYQGQPSAYRDGAPRGEPCASLPPTAFVNFLQNHDQIGNRAFGERLTTLTDATTAELLTAVLLLAPHTPLIFMGEEWGERRPSATSPISPAIWRRRCARDAAPNSRSGRCSPIRPTARRSRPERAGDRGLVGDRLGVRRNAPKVGRASRWCASCSAFARARSCRASPAPKGGQASLRDAWAARLRRRLAAGIGRDAAADGESSAMTMRGRRRGLGRDAADLRVARRPMPAEIVAGRLPALGRARSPCGRDHDDGIARRACRSLWHRVLLHQRDGRASRYLR